MQTKLLRTLSVNKQGAALIRKAKKIFIDNTTLLYAINGELGKQTNVGTQRELFVLNQLQNAGYVPTHSTSGDIIVNKIVLAVGGKNKDRSQIAHTNHAYLVLDDILIGDKYTIPLYLFGFLY
ncbi:MAG: hypothetical protein HYV32_01675 [Candidatus Kerfeldbacteria bacterium]|nr:hypothetical protein [Candidatus Kerfeldbacteria bacterium]